MADYGAYGDGINDDTAAINAAIADGNRCGINCLSSSVKGAIIYFPQGTFTEIGISRAEQMESWHSKMLWIQGIGCTQCIRS